MALMAGPRRLLGMLILMMIAIPGLSMPFQRARIYSAAEYRKLAASPGWPQTRAWASWPKSIDRYLGDHFAFREALVKVGNRTFGRVTAPGAPPSVLDGGDGRLFLFEGLLASTGHEVDTSGAHDYASFACDLAGRLRAMRARLVVSIAPSPADIYPDDAPDLALPVYKPTNYDLIMAGLRGCGVSAVDLRPSLRAAKDAWPTVSSHGHALDRPWCLDRVQSGRRGNGTSGFRHSTGRRAVDICDAPRR